MSERRALAFAAVALALLALVPVVAVVARGAAPGAGETWAHLAGTVLPRSYRGEEFGHWLAGAPLVSP